jgi:hypothetical protein
MNLGGGGAAQILDHFIIKVDLNMPPDKLTYAKMLLYAVVKLPVRTASRLSDCNSRECSLPVQPRYSPITPATTVGG